MCDWEDRAEEEREMTTLNKKRHKHHGNSAQPISHFQDVKQKGGPLGEVWCADDVDEHAVKCDDWRCSRHDHLIVELTTIKR